MQIQHCYLLWRLSMQSRILLRTCQLYKGKFAEVHSRMADYKYHVHVQCLEQHSRNFLWGDNWNCGSDNQCSIYTVTWYTSIKVNICYGENNLLRQTFLHVNTHKCKFFPEESTLDKRSCRLQTDKLNVIDRLIMTSETELRILPLSASDR